MTKKKFDYSQIFFKKITAEEYNSKIKKDSEVSSIWVGLFLVLIYFVERYFDIGPAEAFCEILYYFSNSVPDFRF
jgi:hypothetical protein